jgi:SAM-dependent methyltransferase
MPGFFGRKEGADAGAGQERTARHSSGWAQMLKHLKAVEGLRVLDIGPTSSNNINFLTSLGHSIYMADVAPEAANAEWLVAAPDGSGAAGFDIDGFLAQNLNFSGRVFDVVLLWDTLDYLPDALIEPLLARLYEVMVPGARMLAFFHLKPDGAETAFSRYHLTESEDVSMQRIGGPRLLHVYTTRQVEQMLREFAGHKFFLAKDALREVLVTR